MTEVEKQNYARQQADMWAGTFGDDYTVRNDVDYGPRDKFWSRLIVEYKIGSVLEVGCNTGMNLAIIDKYVPEHEVWGCDINNTALRMAKIRNRNANIVYGSGFELPFRDAFFDLAFTSGVLIHCSPDMSFHMMKELVRVSKKYVMAIEYPAMDFEEIEYRGHAGALFKGPYGENYQQAFGLTLVDHGDLGKEDGFDRVRWWLLRR